MDATPLITIVTGSSRVRLDAHQTVRYLGWAIATGQMGECGKSFVELNDLSCYADRPMVPFTDPITDNADWLSPSHPQSAGFLGFLVRRVDIGRPATLRDITPIVTGGGVAGRASRQFRTVRVVGEAVATGPAELLYGLDWLERVCRQPPCTDPLATSAAEVRLWCPDPGDDLSRSLTRIESVVLGSFTVLDETRNSADSCCQQIATVEIVWQATNPYLFGALTPAGIDTASAPVQYSTIAAC